MKTRKRKPMEKESRNQDDRPRNPKVLTVR